MALLTLPAAVGISLIADPLIKLAFGVTWAAAVPLVQILALAGALMLFGLVSSTLFSAHALLREMVGIGLGILVLRVALLIFFIERLGLYGAAIAAAISIMTEQGIYVWLTIRHFAVSLPDLLRATWRALLATAAMAVVLSRTGFGWQTVAADPATLVRQLLVAISLGAAVYGVALLAAWLAAGRPSGAETDLLALIRGMSRRLAGALWSR